jgi:formylglycine-generating enzyme required for sulfatase activity
MKFIFLITAAAALLLALVWPVRQAAWQQSSYDRGQRTKAPAERRVALVIGNGKYGANYADGLLDNPVNDANALAAALHELGFEVVSDINQDLAGMRRLIRQFGERLRGAEAGLFFFSGHGVQVGGVNYLIPLGHQIEREADIELEAVSAAAVLAQMEAAGAPVNLVMLDACRDNPFRPLSRTQGQRGLVRMTAPSGTLIVYATKPGAIAVDGRGWPNSPFTTSLLQHIRTPGLKVEELFKRIAVGVETLTNRKQSPWVEGVLRGDFYFTEPPETQPAPTPPVYSGEQALWRAIENSTDAQDFRDYLQQYPKGEYGAAARVKLRRLEAAANAAPVTPPNNSAPVKPSKLVFAYAKVAGPPVLLVSMPFTTAVVDARGNVTKQPEQHVNGFVEELGNGVWLEMVEVAGGTFDMGSPSSETLRGDDEGLRRGVRINELYVGRYEVTQAQWKAVMKSMPAVSFKSDDLPVERISWNDAINFCKKLSSRTGREYRLPTEAEWEYAARAATQPPFAFGATITPEIANYDSNHPYGNVGEGVSRGKTWPIERRDGVANMWGLFDVHGNVWEWCQDWYGPYSMRQLNNPTGPSKGEYRVLRGGSWVVSGGNCRAAHRNWFIPGGQSFDDGLRVVISARTRP